MTLEEFRSLRRGHVVIWRDTELRVVQYGPADEANPPTTQSRMHVFFLKLKPIGCRGALYQPYTLYSFTDIGAKISGPYTRLHPRQVFRLEKQRVSRWYNLRESMRRWISEAKRLDREVVPSMRCLMTLGRKP